MHVCVWMCVCVYMYLGVSIIPVCVCMLNQVCMSAVYARYIASETIPSNAHPAFSQDWHTREYIGYLE